MLIILFINDHGTMFTSGTSIFNHELQSWCYIQFTHRIFGDLNLLLRDNFRYEGLSDLSIDLICLYRQMPKEEIRFLWTSYLYVRIGNNVLLLLANGTVMSPGKNVSKIFILLTDDKNLKQGPKQFLIHKCTHNFVHRIY